MSVRRENMFPPSKLRPCDCGGERVTEVADGISNVYTCSECDTFLGELLIGPEP